VDCLFCQIVAGQVPAFVVHSDDSVLAFLDTRPVFKGHVLVVPRPHVPTLVDLTDIEPFFSRVRNAAAAVEEGLQAQGSFVAMNNRISQSVPHLHCHVVPRKKGDGLKGFFWPRTKYASDEEAQTYAEAVKSAWK
jgi:histidine triad (HIT) family protein